MKDTKTRKGSKVLNMCMSDYMGMLIKYRTKE